ncbi:MAG: membrane protein insertion efficiency factor YidD [Firmicutes bacterium]|nr:membrane protein insertion efficiency factor YidD [Bacillota bacterium]
MKRILLFFLRMYSNYLSPLFPSRCRFYPSCSRYCIESIERYGVVRGAYLTSMRLLRCHPFNPGGYDPVVKFYGEKEKRRLKKRKSRNSIALGKRGWKNDQRAGRLY